MQALRRFKTPTFHGLRIYYIVLSSHTLPLSYYRVVRTENYVIDSEAMECRGFRTPKGHANSRVLHKLKERAPSSTVEENLQQTSIGHSGSPHNGLHSPVMCGCVCVCMYMCVHVLVSHSQTLARRESLVNCPYKTYSNTHPNWGGR